LNTALARQLRRYLVTDPRAQTADALISNAAAALAGGMTAVQLRVKGWPDREALQAALGLRAACSAVGALFLVNDRVDIALASRADGVHLGVEDLPVFAARALLGPRAVIGYSPEGDVDRIAAERAGADYLGVGPVFSTATKHDAGPAIGLAGLSAIVRASFLPIVGVGGITIDRAADVLAAGAVGVAMVGAVFLADDPELAAASLRAVLS
jgi:thiamine-phosphate diphosphorylase